MTSRGDDAVTIVTLQASPSSMVDVGTSIKTRRALTSCVLRRFPAETAEFTSSLSLPEKRDDVSPTAAELVASPASRVHLGLDFPASEKLQKRSKGCASLLQRADNEDGNLVSINTVKCGSGEWGSHSESYGVI